MNLNLRNGQRSYRAHTVVGGGMLRRFSNVKKGDLIVDGEAVRSQSVHSSDEAE